MNLLTKLLLQKTSTTLVYLSILIGSFTLGCAADLSAEDNEIKMEEQEQMEQMEQMEPSSTVSSELVIDSTSEESWIYFDLDTYLENPESLESSLSDDLESISGWDIAFKRYQIMSNGGVSGSGNVEIAIIKDQDYESIEQAPSEDYQVDAEDSEADEDTNPDYVFNQADAWYSYDISSHTLKTKAYTYVIKSTQENYFKVSIDDYYNEVGDSGHVTMRVESVLAP